MEPGTIDATRHGDVLTLTLRRPERRNALTMAMRQALCGELSRAEGDAAVRVVVITGADPAFCAGVDFTEALPGWNAFDAQFSANPGRVLRAMSTPVICAVNGPCVAGGLEIALSSSFIVASERARFADTHARLGAVATWGLTALLPRAVGIRRATEMSLTGEFVDAPEALRLGFVNHVVAHDELGAFTADLAGRITTDPAGSETMRLYQRTSGLTLSEALAIEAEHTSRRGFDPAAFEARGARLTGEHAMPPKGN